MWQGEWILFDPQFVSAQGDLGRTLPPEYIFRNSKILLQRTRRGLARKLIPVLDKEGYYNLNRLSNVVLFEGSNYEVGYILALLASSCLDTYFNWVFQEYEVKPAHLRQLPIRQIEFSTPVERRVYLRGEAQKLYQQSLSLIHISEPTRPY